MHSHSGSELANIAAFHLIAAAGAVAVFAVLAFIFLRRVIRGRYLRRRDECAMWIRTNWNDILAGVVPASTWKARALMRRTVEEIALDRRDVADPAESHALDEFFRTSGMLDCRKHLARKRRGWERQTAIQALGRMRAMEAAAVVSEALGERNSDVVFEAVRALARIGTPQAGATLVARLRESLACPVPVIESALLACYDKAPDELLRETLEGPQAIRPLLSRALAAIARPGMSADVAVLAADSSPDVRAAAARILGTTRAPGAPGILCQLVQDPVWFVRLRAAAALGTVGDPFTIPSILRALCDQNRLVRLRAACALATFQSQERRILELTHSTGDRYALQAYLGELDRAGKLWPLITELALEGSNALSPVLDGGALHRLEEMAAKHPNAVVRQQIAKALDRQSSGAIESAAAKDPSEDFLHPAANRNDLACAVSEPVEGTAGDDGRTSCDTSSPRPGFCPCITESPIWRTPSCCTTPFERRERTIVCC